MKIEEALTKLEEITARLEKTDLPLEEAIELFEIGLNVAAEAKKALEGARLRVDQVLERTRGTFDLEALDGS
ncbi:MAG: exodeoxyribonuclease VII small subunit [Candidatus Bipolaricaulota bacterium]